MNKPQKSVQVLVEEACRHPAGSTIRQKRLTQIIRQVSDQLWYEAVPYYQDALQQTWVYFCCNICEATTAQKYDPQKASIVTWLNAYLKRRLQDGYIAARKQPSKPRDSDPIAGLAARPDIPPLLTEVREWAETTSRLQGIHVTGRRHVTARLLILKRLPPETPWKELAAELSVPMGTLASFYQRQCMPLLREFGREQGYL